MWVARTGDEACYRGTRIPYEPRIILGMFASNSGTEVGVISNGELDGDDNSPVMVKTVQVGAEWGAGVIVVVGRRGGGTERAAGVIVVVGPGEEMALVSSAGLLPASVLGGVSIASDRSRTQVARDNRRAAADLRCGRMAVMAWSCRRRRWLR